MSGHDIKRFIDFFNNASIKIRKDKPKFVRGKDGNLVKSALKNFSAQQLEMLAVWFLEKKRKMSTSIGAMLSSTVLEELDEVIRNPNFWKDIDKIYTKYYKINHDITKRQ